jgi:hypothetical protein
MDFRRIECNASVGRFTEALDMMQLRPPPFDRLVIGARAPSLSDGRLVILPDLRLLISDP